MHHIPKKSNNDDDHKVKMHTVAKISFSHFYHSCIEHSSNFRTSISKSKLKELFEKIKKYQHFLRGVTPCYPRRIAFHIADIGQCSSPDICIC